MKQFKELSIDEQLDLVRHVLEGNDLVYYTEVQAKGTLLGGNDNFQIHGNYSYEKLPTKLETLYKAQQDIQSKIDAELKRLGEPVSNDNTSPVQSPSEQEKTSEDAPLERITLENWKSLDIEVGDCVRFEEVAYHELSKGVYTIECLEDCDYYDHLFIGLEDCWWEYYDSDVAYLIRTKEGSLG